MDNKIDIKILISPPPPPIIIIIFLIKKKINGHYGDA